MNIPHIANMHLVTCKSKECIYRLYQGKKLTPSIKGQYLPLVNIIFMCLETASHIEGIRVRSS